MGMQAHKFALALLLACYICAMCSMLLDPLAL